MKTQVEKINPTRVRLDVEVPFSELKDDFTKAYKTIAQQVRIPGFRPGKAPAKLLEARFGRGVVLEQVVQDALPQKYSEAVEQEKLQPLGKPEIDIKEINDGENILFYAEVDVRPEISLPELSEVTVTIDAIDTLEEIADKELEGLQKRFSTLEEVDRAAAHDDIVRIDLSAVVDGAALEDLASENLSHQIGQASLLEGLDEALIGLSKGESATFHTTLFGKEFKDKSADVTVTLHSVKTQILPELDDEFAQLASKFDTLEELKSDIVEQAESIRDNSTVSKIYEQTLKTLMDTVEFDLPEKLLEDQVNDAIGRTKQQLQDQPITYEEYLELQGTNIADYEQNLRTEAEQSLRTELLLDAVIEKFEIVADQQDFSNEMLRQAQMYNIAPQELLQQIAAANAWHVIFAGASRSKAVQLTAEKVIIKDTQGNTIDVDALQQRLNPPQAAEENAASVGE